MTDKGQVLQYDHDTWMTMKMLKNSINFYEEQPRENDLYGTAKKKEKKQLKYFIEKGVA